MNRDSGCKRCRRYWKHSNRTSCAVWQSIWSMPNLHLGHCCDCAILCLFAVLEYEMYEGRYTEQALRCSAPFSSFFYIFLMLQYLRSSGQEGSQRWRRGLQTNILAASTELSMLRYKLHRHARYTSQKPRHNSKTYKKRQFCLG